MFQVTEDTEDTEDIPIDNDGPTKNLINPFDTQVGGSHYKTRFPFCQPAEFLKRNNIPTTEGHVIRYVLRHDLKNGIEDLRKAKHYLEIIAFCDYGENL